MKILLIAYFISVSGPFQIVNYDADSLQVCEMAARKVVLNHKDAGDLVKIECLQVQSVEEIK